MNIFLTVGALVHAADPDWAVLFGGVATGVSSTITAVLPVALPVLILLASVSIAIALFKKFGIRR